MKTMILHKLVFGFDRARNGIVFEGLLEDGYQFEVVFPIGHVSMIFATEAGALGYCGSPMLGYVDTVDGFLGALETMSSTELGWFGSKALRSVSHAASSAYNATVKKVATQAVAAARKAVAMTPVAKAASAVSAVARGQNILNTAMNLTPAGQVASRALAVAKGQPVSMAVSQQFAPQREQLRVVAQYGANVPGVGTAAGALASGANAALSGQSLTNIAKATVAGTIPGGPLAQAAAMAVANVVQAGVEGNNIARAAAGELINVAVSMAPASTQAVLRSAAQALLSGRNVLTAVQRAAIQSAIAQVPNAGARGVLSAMAAGNVSPQAIVSAAGGELVARAVSSAPGGSTAKLLNASATIAPATPHFPALSANGLAAVAAGHAVSKLSASPPTQKNVSSLFQIRNNLTRLIQSGHPQSGLIVAGLKSAPVAA